MTTTWVSDADGVIRLRTREDILKAHADSRLLEVGGWERQGAILGEFVWKKPVYPEWDGITRKPEEMFTAENLLLDKEPLPTTEPKRGRPRREKKE
jgi:hypothetical protein